MNWKNVLIRRVIKGVLRHGELYSFTVEPKSSMTARWRPIKTLIWLGNDPNCAHSQWALMATKQFFIARHQSDYSVFHLGCGTSLRAESIVDFDGHRLVWRREIFSNSEMMDLRGEPLKCAPDVRCHISGKEKRQLSRCYWQERQRWIWEKCQACRNQKLPSCEWREEGEKKPHRTWLEKHW